jgi:hypothetical protein
MEITAVERNIYFFYFLKEWGNVDMKTTWESTRFGPEIEARVRGKPRPEHLLKSPWKKQTKN